MKKSTLASLVLLLCLFAFTGFVITNTPKNRDVSRRKIDLPELSGLKLPERANIWIKQCNNPYLIYDLMDKDSVSYKNNLLELKGASGSILFDRECHHPYSEYIIGLREITSVPLHQGDYCIDSFKLRFLMLDMRSGTVNLYNCDIDTLEIVGFASNKIQLSNYTRIGCLKVPAYMSGIDLEIAKDSYVENLIFNDMELNDIELKADAGSVSKIKHWEVKDKILIGKEGL